MKLIKPSYEIQLITPNAIQEIESAARVCYKSEALINSESSKDFVKNLIKRNHTAMLEFADMRVKFIANRGFTHEEVRMRLTSNIENNLGDHVLNDIAFAQESTRYCDYSKGKHSGEIQIAQPNYFTEKYLVNKNPSNWLSILKIWTEQMQSSEIAYLELRELGVPAQEARDVLPIGLKAEIVVKTNLREWRHIFNLRAAGSAHPIMHELMRPLLKEVKERIPVVFDDIKEN